jgi:hypothetical protein
MSGFIDQNNPTPRVIQSKLGIQRDGTAYKSEHYINGQHTRFFHEWAEKIGGYEIIDIGNQEIVGSMYGIHKSVSNDVYLGRPSSLSYFNINNQGAVTPEVNRTPSAGFIPDPDNLWVFTGYSTDTGLTTDSTTGFIVAQVAPNRRDVASQAEGPIFIGNDDDNNPLTQIFDGQIPVAPVLASGGVIRLGAILVAYGNNGVIRWSDVDNPNSWPPALSQTIANTKIVHAIEYFGSLLLWSLGSLIRATYVPSSIDPNTMLAIPSTFDIQVISNNISIISPNCVTQYNQLVFWVGNGQFYIFNGSVGRLQNYMSNNYFFDALNQQNSQKCFTWVNTLYDEIWFMYPRNNNDTGFMATECNAAVIYNVGRSTWYDTFLSRSSALSLSTYKYPILSSSQLFTTIIGGVVYNTYPIWQHEKGVDVVDFNKNHLPIYSNFEYSIYDLYTHQPSADNNRLVQTMRIEPDFIISGQMELRVNNKMYAAEANPVVTGPILFDATTRFIDSAVSQGRQVSLSFTSNVVGGNYSAGKILHGIIAGDIQP